MARKSLIVLVNNTDITAQVVRNSVRVTESLNNRSNQLAFSVQQLEVSEASLVEVWETIYLAASVTAGAFTLTLEDIYSTEQKIRVGDRWIVKVGTPQATEYIVASTSGNSVTFTTALPTLTTADKIAKIVFAGVTLKNPDEEIGVTGTFVYKLTAVDFSRILDAKIVAETFQDQWSREIIGRIVYEYCAPDAAVTLDRFESAWTPTGVARAMVNDGADRIDGAYSQATGTTGAGIATWEKILGAPLDISALKKVRLWHKTGAGYGNSITALKYRVGSSAVDYFEWSSAWVGSDNEDCWNLETFRIDRATRVGTPNAASISRLTITATAGGSIPSGGVHFEHSEAFSGGFSLSGVERGSRKFVDVRVQHKKPTVVIEDLSKMQGYFWYVDYERDLKFFAVSNPNAPFQLTDSSQNFDNLSITADISQLKNRQTVRGGIAADESTYTQDEKCDGVTESFRLDYGAKGLRVFVDTTGTGSAFVEKTVGVENLTDPATVQWLFNFSEKVVRRASDSIPPNGAIFRRVYYPYRPVRVRIRSDDSITRMKALLGGDGIYDGATISDASLVDFNEARLRAQAEVNAYANPILSADFITEQDGLKTGQVIRIVDTSRGIDQGFVIQKIQRTQRDDIRWRYSVSCASSMFGLIEFFQLLLRKTEKFEIEVSESVDIVETVDEVITITDTVARARRLRPWYVHGRALPYNGQLTLTEGGTSLDGYADYCEA